MARLVILSEGLTGKAHELTADKTTLGRVDDNTFPISEGSVSSHHAEVVLRGTDIVIRDLNSTNGTFINGQQITTEAVLKPGQILRLGQVELRLEDESKSTSGKKLPDQTMVIPQGVKLGQEPSTKPVAFEKSGFAKKTNKGAKIFAIVAIALLIVILGIIFYFIRK